MGEEAPRQQRRKAAHPGCHVQGVSKEVGQVEGDKPRHTGVEAADSDPEDEHLPAVGVP